MALSNINSFVSSSNYSAHRALFQSHSQIPGPDLEEQKEKSAQIFDHGGQQFSPLNSSSRVNVYRVEQRQAISLQIETKDGDLVTIEIRRNSGTSQTEFFANSGTERLSGHIEKSFLSENITFSVEGELSKDERKEISKLIRKTAKFVKKFSRDLSNGRLDKALKHANRLGFKTQHLAGYSLTAESVKTIQVASAYQQQTEVGSTSESGLDNVVRAADFVQNAAELLNQTQAARDEFKKPLDVLKDLVIELKRLTTETEQQIEEIEQKNTDRLLSSVFGDIRNLSNKQSELAVG